MSDTLVQPRFERIEDSGKAPAVWREDWLPDIDVDLFPELPRMRSEYLRLQGAWSAAGERVRALAAQIEQAEASRAEALRDAFLAGEDPTDVGDDVAVLRAQLAGAKEQSQAAASAFVEHINRCIGLVAENAEAWTERIDAFYATLDEQVEALIAQATALRRSRGDFTRLRVWVQRTGVEGAAYPPMHIGYADIPRPPASDPAEREAEELEAALASYAGGLAPVPPADEADYEANRRQVLAPRAHPKAPDDTTEELDDDDLVDWLMGTGAWDGKQKPDEAAVIAAAEGNATMAKRLLAAEMRANESAPRRLVVDELTRIGGQS